MKEIDTDTLLFFDKQPAALTLYEAFHGEMLRRFPSVSTRVQKTQIAYAGRHVFACVSFLRVRKKAELPEPYIVVTLGLPAPPALERAAACTEPYPGRWTVHIVVHTASELDEELFSLVNEAYLFAESKEKKPQPR